MFWAKLGHRITIYPKVQDNFNIDFYSVLSSKILGEIFKIYVAKGKGPLFFQISFTLLDLTLPRMKMYRLAKFHMRGFTTGHSKIEQKKFGLIAFVLATALLLVFGSFISSNTGYAANIKGTKKKDYIFAVDPSNVIKSLAGNDEIHGGTGTDMIDGGAGDDYILGDDGNDVLLGGAGSDSIFGGPGDDKISGGKGDDFLVGNGGSDTFIGGPGADTFVCDSGNDVVKDFNPSENDTISGNCKT